MRFEFRKVPVDPAQVARPLLTLELEGVVTPATLLIDTGSIYNRLPSIWAREAGIDLKDRSTDTPAIGGVRDITFWIVEDVQVTLGDVSLNLEIRFGEGWEAPFGLLGQEGFLQYCQFTMSTAEQWFELDFPSG